MPIQTVILQIFKQWILLLLQAELLALVWLLTAVEWARGREFVKPRQYRANMFYHLLFNDMGAHHTGRTLPMYREGRSASHDSELSRRGNRWWDWHWDSNASTEGIQLWLQGSNTWWSLLQMEIRDRKQVKVLQPISSHSMMMTLNQFLIALLLVQLPTWKLKMFFDPILSTFVNGSDTFLPGTI